MVRARGDFTPKTEHSQRRSFQLLSDLMSLERTSSELVFLERGAQRTSVANPLIGHTESIARTRRRPMHVTLHMLRKAHAKWHAEQELAIRLQDRQP